MVLLHLPPIPLAAEEAEEAEPEQTKPAVLEDLRLVDREAEEAQELRDMVKILEVTAAEEVEEAAVVDRYSAVEGGMEVEGGMDLRRGGLEQEPEYPEEEEELAVEAAEEDMDRMAMEERGETVEMPQNLNTLLPGPREETEELAPVEAGRGGMEAEAIEVHTAFLR